MKNNIVRKDDKIDNLESSVKDLKGKVAENWRKKFVLKSNWHKITEEEIIDDELEAIKTEKFEKEIEDYYKEAVEKSRPLRKIYKEWHIRKLFDEKWSLGTG